MLTDGDDPLLKSVLENSFQGTYIAVASFNLALVDMVRLLKNPNIHHVASGPNMANDLLSVASKVLTGDFFGIEKHLSKDSIVTRKRLTTFKGRGDAIDEVLSYAEESSVRKKVRTSIGQACDCLLYTSPSPRDATLSRMPSSA